MRCVINEQGQTVQVIYTLRKSFTTLWGEGPLSQHTANEVEPIL